MRDWQPRIFVSYRRADSAAIVDHLYERLVGHFHRDCIFRDIDSIPIGEDFRSHITRFIGSCDIVLAIVGPGWVGAAQSGSARIQGRDDPVKTEIEVALASEAVLVPVLVGGAVMPLKQSLPQSLRRLPMLNAAKLDTGRDFEHHLAQLFSELERILRACGKSLTRLPPWLKTAALAALAVALLPLASLVAAALLGIAVPVGAAPLALVVSALAAAIAVAAWFVERAVARSWAGSLPRRRPALTGGLVAILAFAPLYAMGALAVDALPLRDTAHLSRELLAEFGKARADIVATGGGDFTAANRIVDRIRRIDADNGGAWYFAGEIQRLRTPRLFDSQGCFKGWPGGKPGNLDPYQQDFYRYLDTEREVGEATGRPDWGTEVCYGSPRGFCPQRTAWIYQLLANDHVTEAMAAQGEVRRAHLRTARDFVRQALRYPRPEGGVGFTQCKDSSVMRAEIDAALGPDRAD